MLIETKEREGGERENERDQCERNVNWLPSYVYPAGIKPAT